MHNWAIIFAVVLLIVATGWCHADNTIKDMSVDQMSFSFTPADGLSLRYHGVSIFRESTLWVHNPNWSTHYYGYPYGEKTASIQEIEGGKQAIITHRYNSFEGTQTITLLKNKAIYDLKFKLKDSVDSPQLEYNVGFLSAGILAGCPFEADTKNGVVKGNIPLKAVSPDPKKTHLTEVPFNRLMVDTRLGKLTLTQTNGSEGMVLFDARENRVPWAEKGPVFWCGIENEDLKVKQEYQYTVTIEIEPNEIKTPTVTAVNGDKVSAQDQAELRVPAAGSVLVIPQPKEMKLSSGDFILNNKVQLVVSENAKPEDLRGAQSFAQELRSLYNLTIEVVRESKINNKSGLILIGEPTRNQLLDEAANAEGVRAPEKEEGYALKVTPDRVLVLGHDQRGTYYGMQTLKQLVKASSSRLTLQGCTINDYPSMTIRGVHLFTGNKALPFHKKLVDRIFSRFKMNHFFMQADYIQWKSCPEIALDWAMSQDDVKKDIQYARDHFMEVTPLVQSLGHSEWMFQNGKNLDLCEDPKFPYAYCTENPKTYDFIFKIYDEAVELFDHPKWFHIGHDEVTLFARFPNHEQCKKKSITDHVLDDIARLRDHLKAKGCQVMIWGDMFLAPGECIDACSAHSVQEAKERRNRLPKDVVIANWHYADGEPNEFTSSKLLINDGFQEIACTWLTPGNIANFAEAAKKAGSQGLMQTTWAGYNSNEDNLKENYDQFTAFVLAAEYAWNSGTMKLEDLPYQPEEVFKREWDRTQPDRKARKGFTLDLSSLYNTTLADNVAKRGWVGMGPDFDLSTAPTGLNRIKGDLYQLAENNAQNSAIRLYSNLEGSEAYPVKVVIPVGKKADSLLFLHTCAWPENTGAKVGVYKVNYEDGTSAEINLIYGQNITYWQDRRICVGAPIAWGGKDKAGQKVSIRKLEWTNNHSDKVIKNIEFKAVSTEASPTLLAVSGFVEK